MNDAPPRSTPLRRLWWGVAVVGLVVLIVVSTFWWPRSTESLFAQARTALASGDLERACSAAEQIVRRDPQHRAAWAILAEAGFRRQDRAVWEPAFQQLERGEAFELWLKLGSTAMQRFQAAPAELALRKATVLAPERPEAWRLLEQLLSIQGRPRETTECLMALIRLKEFTAADLRALSWPYAAIDQPERVQELLRADPNHVVPALSFVGGALNRNDAEEAERLLRGILATHPKQSRASALLGLLLAERDAPDFLSWQKESAVVAADEPETWIAQGLWLRKHGQLPAATRAFHRAVELDPRHLQALTELGHALIALDQRTLGADFLAFARQQQEITELAKRVDEKVNPEVTRSLVDRLEVAGRLWEAAAWSRMHSHAWPDDAAMRTRREAIEARLTPETPRVLAAAVPGRNFEWDGLAAPDWSASPETRPTPIENGPPLVFRDDAAAVGIDFRFVNGTPDGRSIVQTGGGGVAALDYDRDGWPDLYFTQGGADQAATSQTEVDHLYRNRGGNDFVNVTTAAGLREDRFSQGPAVGDIDNDGFPDLFIANLGQNRLYRNNGDGTFSDITDAAGLRSTGWTTCVAIADLNRDGHPELFSVRYVRGDDIHTRTCRDPSGQPGVCRPTVFEAEADILALNLGDGRFEEQIESAGLDLPDGRGFGLVVAHFDGDERLDVFVANDQTANFLLRQQPNSGAAVRFTEEALPAGVAFDRDGFPQACMGVAAGDLNHDGLPELFITNFAEESATLYVSQPYGGYADETRAAALRDPTFHPLGFGTQFLDADLDGRPDLVVLNGHIYDTSALGVAQAMLPQLFRGRSDGRFEAVINPDPQDFFRRPRIGRGLCTLDWNRDGRPDFAGSFLDGQAALGTNITVPAGNWLKLDLAGVRSNRDGIGARVEVRFADGSVARWQATAGDGFAAANERGWLLGLSERTELESLTIRWPSGQTDRWTQVTAGQRWLAIEGRPALTPLP